MMMMATTTTSSAVREGVRVRPLTNQEIGQGGKSVLHARAPEVRLGERRFTYDAVFDAHVQQEELYQSVSKPLLNSFLEGFNATVSKKRPEVQKFKESGPSLTPCISPFYLQSPLDSST